MAHQTPPATTRSTYAGTYLKPNRDPNTGRVSWYFRIDPRHRPAEWCDRFPASIRLPRDPALRTGLDKAVDPSEHAAAFREAAELYEALLAIRGQTGAAIYPRGSLRWLIGEWRTAQADAAITDDTRAFYDMKLKHIEAWADEVAHAHAGVHHHVSRLTPLALYNFLSRWDHQPTLRGHLRTVLGMLLGHAVLHGVIPTNPLREVQLRKRRRGHTRSTPITLWTDDFVSAFAAAARADGHPEAAALALCMWDVGQRPTDLLRLVALSQMEHEALQRGRLDPGFYYDPFTGKMVGWQQKTQKFVDIPLDEVTLEALAEIAPAPGSNQRHVFANPHSGEPFTLDQFSKLFRRLADKIGWTGATFRQGRHSAIVRMLRVRDITPLMVTTISGHDNPEMIRLKYGVGDSDMAAEAKRRRAEHEGR